MQRYSVRGLPSQKQRAPSSFAERFFAPLIYVSETADLIGQVYHVNRENPFIGTTLARLAFDLDGIVADFTEFYSRLFYGLREGHAGEYAQQIAMAVFEQWCGKSLRVTPQVAAKALTGGRSASAGFPVSRMRNATHYRRSAAR